ncbi:MAG: hypothetical protein COA79_21740 [Planctomycetota bacterium]|nr:MAG: hypothetical protein COA79_21740 [Planctomycetota bacterium]
MIKNKTSDKRKKELLDMILWDTHHLAEFLEMNIASVRNMVTRDEIPYLRRINKKKYYVHVESFIRWFSEQPTKKKPKNYPKAMRL